MVLVGYHFVLFNSLLEPLQHIYNETYTVSGQICLLIFALMMGKNETTVDASRQNLPKLNRFVRLFTYIYLEKFIFEFWRHVLSLDSHFLKLLSHDILHFKVIVFPLLLPWHWQSLVYLLVFIRLTKRHDCDVYNLTIKYLKFVDTPWWINARERLDCSFVFNGIFYHHWGFYWWDFFNLSCKEV